MFRKMLFALAVTGCATTLSPVLIDYQYIDKPEAKRIELSYRNNTDGAVCLTADDWPDSNGKLDSMGGRVFLLVGDQRFAIKDFNTGYCPRGCWQRVAPGEEITGFLPYEDFDLPEQFESAPKVLEFKPQGETCR